MTIKLLNNSLPKVFLDKYNKTFTKIKVRKPSTSSSSMFQLETIEQAFSQNNSKKTIENIDPHIIEDQVSDIEIIGINKLKSEAHAVKRINGPKFFIKNHYYNQFTIIF